MAGMSLYFLIFGVLAPTLDEFDVFAGGKESAAAAPVVDSAERTEVMTFVPPSDVPATAPTAAEMPSPEMTPVAQPATEVPGSDAMVSGFMHQVQDVLGTDLNTGTFVRLAARWLPSIAAALAVFVIGRLASRIIGRMIDRAARKARMDETVVRFIGSLSSIIMLLVVVIASLGCLGVDTTSLSAVLVASGFAIGMALQGSLGNVASGVLLVFFRPFRVGDTIEVAGSMGKVVEIQIFNTILVSPDNVRIILPNSTITGGTIRNLSAEPIRRIDLVIGCSYNDSLRDVRALLEEIIATEPRVLRDPAPVIAVSEMAESSVNFVVRPWVAGADFHTVRFALTERIKLGFDERGLTIPFPSRDVFVHHAGGTMTVPMLNGAAASAA